METQEKSDNTAEEVKTRVVNSNPEKGQDGQTCNTWDTLGMRIKSQKIKIFMEKYEKGVSLSMDRCW